ncbi:MAG TPA: dockerin, partial [Polyangia bacterium]
QSLAVGGQGNATPTPIGATTQPFHNLKLSLGSVSVPPWTQTTASGLSMVPLVEPLRTITTTYPSAYPKNIYGESVHTAMSDELTSLSMTAGQGDFVSAHTEVGEAGQPIAVISKGATDTGTMGRAYLASLFEVGAIAHLAKAQGKTYGVGAILLNHGESDAASTTYESDMVTLWSNYNQDLPPLTGQTFAIPMLLSQQHSNPMDAGTTSPATVAQWKIGVDHPGQIICTGPKYQYAYVSDFTHLIDKDYERLGEKDAQIFYQRVVLGSAWQPLQPTGASRSGQVITVTFHVPVSPLAWDTTLPMPHQASNTAWAQGKGFEVLSGTTPVTISSVAIAGSSVQVTVASALPASGVTVAYAFTADSAPRTNGTVRWGLLHDSDPFVGYLTGMPGQNYALAFQMTVP